MIRYYKLFDLLTRRGLRKMNLVTDLKLSRPTMTKISQGKTITTETIDRICGWLNVQPGDIMEYIPDVQQQGAKGEYVPNKEA